MSRKMAIDCGICSAKPCGCDEPAPARTGWAMKPELIAAQSSGPKTFVGRFFEPRMVQAGETVELRVELEEMRNAPLPDELEEPWAPHHITFPRHLKGKGFVVLDVLVGQEKQMWSSQSVPLEVFIEGEVGVHLGCDRLTASAPLKMKIRNDGPNAEMVYGFVAGREPLDAASSHARH